MTAVLVPGQRTWSGNRDEDGHRNYKIVHRVEASSLDGPAIIMNTPGLPVPGSQWNVDNDVDVWAWCKPNLDINPVVTDDKNRFWDVTNYFTTRPPSSDAGSRGRCVDQQITDPLLEPHRVSGGFVKYMVEATHDRFGNPVVNSSWEQLRGQQVEFDENRPTIKIEQNVLYLGIEIFAPMVDTVNAFPLWGLPPRTIKLSSVSWERKLYGTCTFYFTRTLEFDINYNTFDRVLLDEGTKVLKGRWNNTSGRWELLPIAGATPNSTNPTHYIRAIDREGNYTRVILNGRGQPYAPDVRVSAGPNTVESLFDAPDNWSAVNQAKAKGGGQAGAFGTPGTPTDHILISDDYWSEYNFGQAYVPFAWLQSSVTNITITSVTLKYYTQVTGAAGNSATLTHGYRVGDTEDFTNLASYNGNQDFLTEPDEHDITAAIGGSWNNIFALQTRVRLELDGSAGQVGAVDVVELEVRGTEGAPGRLLLQKYNESNFLVLNIPILF